MQEVLVKIHNGYKIKEICIDDDIFGGKEIKNLNANLYSNYICVELIYNELLYTQINKINWVILEED